MGHALVAAAREAGIRIALLDTCYLSSGLRRARRRACSAVQRRRRRRLGRAGRAASPGTTRRRRRRRRRDPLGPRRPRRADATVVDWARRRRRPLHVHLSEQVGRERRVPRGVRRAPRPRCSPTTACSARCTTAVHATHLTDDDVALPRRQPDLRLLLPDHRARPRRRHRPEPPAARGRAPAHARQRQPRGDRPVRGDARASSSTSGSPPSSAGTGRAAELLDRRDRATATPASASATPARSRSASAPTWSPSTPPARARPAPARDEHTAVFAATAADVTQVVVDGRVVVRQGDREDDRAASSTPRSGRSWAVTQHRHHRHRRAGHQRPRRATTCSASHRRRARRRGRPRRLGRAAPPRRPPPTSRSTPAAGPCCPGFVDSHSHLVFAGDRAPEFAARMAGEPYAAGGIRTTVAATRAATDEQLTSHVARLVAGDAPPGHDHASRSRAATA